MTFPAELERLLKEATDGPSYLTDRWLFGEGKRKYPVASFQFYGSKQQDRELLLFLRNHVDAILGLVRAAETHVRLHGKIGCDKGIAQALKEFGEEMTLFSSNPEPLAWDGLPKLNGEGK